MLSAVGFYMILVDIVKEQGKEENEGCYENTKKRPP